MSSDAGPGGHGGPGGDITDAETMAEMAAAGLGPDSFDDATDAGDINSPNYSDPFSGYSPGTGEAGGQFGDDTLGYEDSMSLSFAPSPAPSFGQLSQQEQNEINQVMARSIPEDPVFAQQQEEQMDNLMSLAENQQQSLNDATKSKNSFANTMLGFVPGVTNATVSDDRGMVSNEVGFDPMAAVPDALGTIASYASPFGLIGNSLVGKGVTAAAQAAVQAAMNAQDTYGINSDNSQYAEMGEPTAPAPSMDDNGGGPPRINNGYILPPRPQTASVVPTMVGNPQMSTPYAFQRQRWDENNNFILAPLRRQV